MPMLMLMLSSCPMLILVFLLMPMPRVVCGDTQHLPTDWRAQVEDMCLRVAFISMARKITPAFFKDDSWGISRKPLISSGCGQ
jgi:hypothetical protein